MVKYMRCSRWCPPSRGGESSSPAGRPGGARRLAPRLGLSLWSVLLLELQVAEFDREELRLQTDVAARHLAAVPGQGRRAVDPDLDVLALARDLVGVPLADR